MSNCSGLTGSLDPASPTYTYIISPQPPGGERKKKKKLGYMHLVVNARVAFGKGFTPHFGHTLVKGHQSYVVDTFAKVHKSCYS